MPIVGVRPTTVAALSVLVLAVACGPKNYNYQPEHNTPVAFPGYSGTSTVAETSTAVRAGMGVPVRDGSLEFTVNGLRRTSIAQSPTNPSAQTQVAGEYIIVDLIVKNVGSEPGPVLHRQSVTRHRRQAALRRYPGSGLLISAIRRLHTTGPRHRHRDAVRRADRLNPPVDSAR